MSLNWTDFLWTWKRYVSLYTGSAGAPVIYGGALGTPLSGVVTNLTGTASININGTVGATTPSTGAFTTLSATGTTYSSDYLLLGASNGGGTGAAWVRVAGSLASRSGIDVSDSADASGAAFMAFRSSGGTAIGSITRVTTTNAVAYNTTSDGRLKTNVRDFTAADAGRIIDGLKPRWFDWKASDLTETVEETFDTGKTDEDGKPITEKRQKQKKVKDAARIAKHIEDNKSIIGFIAQEEVAVDPVLARIGAVTVGDSDPANITKQWQRSDTALIPILVAELKALRARVAQLEAA